MSSEQYEYVNMETINDIADGDKEFIREIIENFLSTVSEGVQKLNEAFHNHDEANIIFFAHKLKGTFGFVGAGRLQELASAIQSNAADRAMTESYINAINEFLPKLQSELLHILNNG